MLNSSAAVPLYVQLKEKIEQKISKQRCTRGTNKIKKKR